MNVTSSRIALAAAALLAGVLSGCSDPQAAGGLSQRTAAVASIPPDSTKVITPEGAEPVANADIATTPEDEEVAVDIMANDTGLDAIPLTVNVTSAPAHGEARFYGDGTIHYVPAPNWFGQDSFTYEVMDDNGQTSSASVSVTVQPVDDGPPRATADVAAGTEDGQVTTTVLANDSNLVDIPINVGVGAAPAHGTALVNADGTITYTPLPNFNGLDQYTYRVTDRDEQTSDATVTISVAAVDDGPPVANGDQVTTPEDAPVATAVIANDGNLLDGPFSVRLLTQPAHGTAAVNAGNAVIYTPQANYNGPDSYSYEVTDADGQSSTATASIDVTPVDDGAPSAMDDSETLVADTTATTPVLANDTNLVDAPITLVISSPPANGFARYNGDGTITYQPFALFFGTDHYQYRLTDLDGQTSEATVTVTVNPAGSTIPIARADLDGTNEDLDTDSDVLGNDESLIAPPFTVRIITPPAHGTAQVNADLTVHYVPAPNYNGPDSYEYEVTNRLGESSAAVLSMTVTPMDDGPPVAMPDTASAEEDSQVTTRVLDNDRNLVDAPIQVTILDAPAHGRAEVNEDGSITYTPAPDYGGPDTYRYQVVDLDEQTSSATVAVAVAPLDDGAPSAADDSATLEEDAEITADVLADDTGLKDRPISVSVSAPPEHGRATVNEDNTITYRPAPDWNGSDQLTYRVADLDGQWSQARLSLAVTPVNDGPPVARGDHVTSEEGTPARTAVLQNDTVQDGPARVAVAAQPAHGTATINPDGSITYSPEPHYNGPDSYTYEVTDADGETSTATVEVEVAPVNDGPPDARPDTASTPEDTPVTTAVLEGDGNLWDRPLRVTIAAWPGHGTVEVNPDGTIRYLPDQDYFGHDGYWYTVTDADGQSSTALVELTVTPVDDGPPDAQPDATAIAEDSDGVDLAVLVNDRNLVDAPIDLQVDHAPAHGTATLNADRTLHYRPAADFNGTDSFSYQVTDQDGQTSTGRVDVTVTPVNDAPVARHDSVEGSTRAAEITIAVLANDSDVDGDPLNVISVTQGRHGSVLTGADGTVRWVGPGYVGVDFFSYTISDGQGGTATATVMVNVGTEDADGDGLTDEVERARGMNPHDADSDDDGVIDGSELAWDQDTDGDGLINALDPDSDDDGIFDGTELGLTASGEDTNLLAGNFVPDADPSTITNPLLADTDHGGIRDGAEDANHDGRIDPGEGDPNDPRDDGWRMDSDGDGLSDAEERAHGTDPHDADSDDDGVADGRERNWTADTDGDGLINALDPDTDGDGLFDGTELGITDPGAGTDLAAGRFIPDADPRTATNPLLADTDQGGVPDGAEDANHNGRLDHGERDPLDPADDPLWVMDGMGASGGGCSAGGNGSGQPAALLALVLGALLRQGLQLRRLRRR